MKALRLKIPPVLITLMFGTAMWITAEKLPVFAVILPSRYIVTSALTVLGGLISILGVLSIVSARTTLNPVSFKSVSSLVVTGIYSITRNPMYLGLLFVLIAWAYFLSNIICFSFIPFFILYMNHFQIYPEEFCLETKYGRVFIRYRSKVGRWL